MTLRQPASAAQRGLGTSEVAVFGVLGSGVTTADRSRAGEHFTRRAVRRSGTAHGSGETIRRASQTTPGPAAGDRRSRAIRVVRGLAALVGAAAGAFIWSGIRVGHDILAECPVPAGCAADGFHAPLPVTGIVLNVALGIILIPVLRVLGIGITLGLGPPATVAGYIAAVTAGRLPAEAASGRIGFWSAVAVAGLLIEVRLPGPMWRLFGWVPVPAELRDYTGPPNGSGTAVLAFTDQDGTPRQTVVRVHQKWMWMAVRAWYLTHDPSRVRCTPVRLDPYGRGRGDATTSEPGGTGG